MPTVRCLLDNSGEVAELGAVARQAGEMIILHLPAGQVASEQLADELGDILTTFTTHYAVQRPESPSGAGDGTIKADLVPVPARALPEGRVTDWGFDGQRLDILILSEIIECDVATQIGVVITRTFRIFTPLPGKYRKLPLTKQQ